MKKSKVIDFLGTFVNYVRSTGKRTAAGDPASRRFGEVEEVDALEDFSQRDSANNGVQFDIASLLQLRTFLYLLGGTLVFLAQTYNTLAIINLARQNELLREQIRMTTSVITSQELKVHELHSIHNIAQDALKIGLEPSAIPPVELRP